MRVEATMMSPETEQYAGSGEAGLSIEGIADEARQFEAMGFDGATTPEAGHDPFVPLAIAAANTQKMRLGTNVAISFPRSPMATAQVAWDLQQLSRGRFTLGLGTQVKGHNERRYSTPWTGPPGPRMREYVLCLQAIFRSFQHPKEPSFYDGEHYKFSLLPPLFNPGPIATPHIPIYLAPVNPYMASLAGELCDGLRVHPVSTFAHNREVLLPAIEKGTARANRPLSDIDIVGCPFLAVGKNEAELEAARADVRQRIAFYSSTRTYHKVLDHHGWTDIGQELHSLSLKGQWKEMPKLVSDDMLEEFAVVAVGEELPQKLRNRCLGLFTTVLLDGAPALFKDRDLLRMTIETLQQP